MHKNNWNIIELIYFQTESFFMELNERHKNKTLDWKLKWTPLIKVRCLFMHAVQIMQYAFLNNVNILV